MPDRALAEGAGAQIGFRCQRVQKRHGRYPGSPALARTPGNCI